MEGLAKQFVVGVDIGGQTSKIGLVDARGDVLFQNVIRTDIYGEDAEAYVKDLAAAIRECVDKGGKQLEEVRGVGVGAPNGNYYTGEIATSSGRPTIPWPSPRCSPKRWMASPSR